MNECVNDLTMHVCTGQVLVNYSSKNSKISQKSKNHLIASYDVLSCYAYLVISYRIESNHANLLFFFCFLGGGEEGVLVWF